MYFMQKTNIKASILIWAIFLSLIIWVSFISISTKINKNLQKNIASNTRINLLHEIENIINSWSVDHVFTSQYLSNWDKIIFWVPDSVDFALKKSQTYTWIINENSNITINIENWGPVFFQNNTLSWIVDTNATFLTSTGIFILENLWWFAQINLSSDSTKNYLSPYTSYKILKYIWNKEIIQTTWKIKNFSF